MRTRCRRRPFRELDSCAPVPVLGSSHSLRAALTASRSPGEAGFLLPKVTASRLLLQT